MSFKNRRNQGDCVIFVASEKQQPLMGAIKQQKIKTPTKSNKGENKSQEKAKTVPFLPVLFTCTFITVPFLPVLFLTCTFITVPFLPVLFLPVPLLPYLFYLYFFYLYLYYLDPVRPLKVTCGVAVLHC